MGLFGLKLPKKEEILNPLKGVYHQVNIFDKGRTYDTNQRGVTPGVANPVNIKADNTPGFQITNNSLTRGLSRGFDQANPFDSGRSWQSRVISPQQRSTSGWQQGYRQIIEPGIVTPVQRAANTVAAPIAGTMGLLSGNPEAAGGAMKDLLNSGWGGKGGWGSYEEITSDNFGESFVKPLTRGVADVAPLVVPAIPKTGGLFNRVAVGALESGGANLATDAALQLAETGRIDPKRSAQVTGIGMLAGGALPMVGGGLRGAVRKTGQVVDQAPASMQRAMTKVVDANRRLLQDEGGFVQVGRTPKRVHPEDQATMADFVDAARGVYKPDPRTLYNLELDAARIAERYGITPKGGKNISPVIRLANAFDERLGKEGFGTKKGGLIESTKQSLKALSQDESGFVKLPSRRQKITVEPPKQTGKIVVNPAKTGVKQEVKRGISDADQVILDELRSIEKQTGQKGLVDKFMYLSNQQRGSNRVANVNLERSQNVKTAIAGMKKKDADAFSTYANARTELASALSRKTPTGKQAKVKTSLPVEELQALVKGGEKKFGKRFESLNKHYQELATMAHKAGIIDKKTFETYTKNKDYIRLQRDLDDKIPNATSGRGQGYQLGSTTLKQRRKGSSRATLDAAEVMAERTQQVHREAAKNRTGNMLVDTLESSGLARKVPSTKASTLNTVGVFKNGKKVYYEVSPAMKEAMDNISPYQMNVVMKVLAAPGRVFRAGVTGLNPVFIARNLVKDQVGSAINSKAMAYTHNPKTFFSGLFAASRDAFGGKNSKLYDEFLKHYGDQTSFDLTRNIKDTKDVIAGIRGGKKVRVVQKLKSPIRTLEDFASITEKSTRYQNFKGAYKAAIKKGMDKDAAMEHAALQAWQNSVDFARAGTWGRVINTVLPYWNPATQGVRQMGRTFKDRPISSVFKGTALVGLPLVTATAWNLTEGNKEVYDNIPDFEKENNLILIPPGTKQNDDGTYDVIKVPLPPGFKDVFMPLRRQMEAFAKDEPVKAAEIAQDLLQTVAGPVQVGSKEQFAGSFIPQIAKPSIQAAANRDFFTGRGIVPDYMNEATDAEGNPVKETDKAYKSTSGTARQLANMFGMSPIKVEKFIKDSSGTVGLNLLNLADNLQASAGTIPKEQIGGQSVPAGFRRSFASTQGIENYNKSEGAKYFDTLTKLSNEIKLTKAEKDAWGALHPAKKNFLGDVVYERDATYDPAARLDIYNRFPKTYELDKRLDAEQRKQGKPGNPLFDLENWQLKKVLEKENLPPGAKDPELTNLYQKEWYQNYRAGKTDFFNKLKALAEKEGRTFGSSDNPYPETPKDVQRAMDTYTSLPKGTGARSSWIRSNPGLWLKMQQQFAMTDNWQNIARGKRGLDATEGDIGRMAGYGDSFGGGFSRGGGRSSSGFNAAKYLKKLSVGGDVRKGTPTSKGKVTVKARTSGGRNGKIKVSSRKIRLA